jgi:cysteine desulfurase/selenocysteine lyase
MNEITPDLIASIATRLYNEIPGANLTPKTEADLPNAVPDAVSLSSGLPENPDAAVFPGGDSGGFGAPAGTDTVSSGRGMPHPRGSAPDGMGVPGLSGISSPGQSIPSFKAFTPDGFTLPGTAGIGTQGYSIPAPKSAAPDGFGVPGLSGLSQEPPGVSAGSERSTPAIGTPVAAGSGGDGLRAFVQQVRAGQMRDESGQCPAGLDHDQLRRLIAGKSASGASGTHEHGARPLDIPAIRRDFPALNQLVHGKPLAWFDNGATTQKPQSVIDAISRYYENDNSNIHRGAHTLAARSTDAFEQSRQKVQTFLGASSSKDIVFVRGTTEGINLVAQTYGRKFLQPGDEIILSTLEHHANIVPWQMIAKEKGAVIRVIPVNDRGEVMLEAYEALLGPRTRLVALTQASNSLGTILPVAEMTRAAKRYNARVLIDGAQSVSHMPVNMQEIGCDFFVFSGHKIFAPTGIGAVYVSEELHEILPPWQGGGNMIRNVTFEETTYNEAPAKFEAGTPNIANVVGLGAALDYVNRLGLVNTGRYEHELLQYATEHLSRIDGVRLLGSAREKVSVISFVVRDRKTEEIGKLLDREGIAVRAGHHCAQPSLRRFGVEATVRPSFAFYNTFDEIDRMVDAVRRIVRA